MPLPKTGTRRVAVALAASALLAAGAAGCGGGGGETLGNGVRLVKKDRLTTCTHLPYPRSSSSAAGRSSVSTSIW